MKKILAVLLAVAMAAAMAPAAFADNSGDTDPETGLIYGGVYIKEDDDDDYYTDHVSSLRPGQTGYVYIGCYDRDGDNGEDEAPRSISIETHDVIALDDDDHDDAKKMVSVTSKGERKRVSDDDYGWFAKIKAKSVSMSKYPEDGYDVRELVLEYNWCGDTDVPLTVDLTEIVYEEGDYEFEEDLMMFIYEKDDEVEIDLPDEEGIFTGTARKDFEVVASMDTKVNNSIINKYPNADVRFFNGNGANFPVTKGRLTLYADAGDHCYEVNSDNELVDRSSTYSSSAGGFVISTNTLGSYIVSDTRLSGSVSTASSSPSLDEYIGTTPVVTTPSGQVVITNPSTGACEGQAYWSRHHGGHFVRQNHHYNGGRFIQQGHHHQPCHRSVL